MKKAFLRVLMMVQKMELVKNYLPSFKEWVLKIFSSFALFGSKV
jgi:hypothetical protein